MAIKNCVICGVEFTSQNGQGITCSIAHRLQATRERQRKYRENNLEYLREKSREYYKNNKNKMLEKGRRYYKNNRDKELERSRRYKKENPENHKENKRKSKRKARIRKNQVELNFLVKQLLEETEND